MKMGMRHGEWGIEMVTANENSDRDGELKMGIKIMSVV